MPGYFSYTTPIFQPAMRNILSISQANPALVTTTFDGVTPGDNLYKSGLIVRIVIPKGFGMAPIDKNEVFPITVVSPSSFTIPLDTTLMDAFVVPASQPGFYFTPAQVISVGEVNEQLDQAVQNVLKR